MVSQPLGNGGFGGVVIRSEVDLLATDGLAHVHYFGSCTALTVLRGSRPAFVEVLGVAGFDGFLVSLVSFALWIGNALGFWAVESLLERVSWEAMVAPMGLLSAYTTPSTK